MGGGVREHRECQTHGFVIHIFSDTKLPVSWPIKATNMPTINTKQNKNNTKIQT